MIFLLALVDLLCTICMLLLFFGFSFPTFQAGAAFLLLAKSGFFLSNVLSILDVIAAICMFILLWWSIPTLAIIVAIYLGIKGLYSLV